MFSVQCPPALSILAGIHSPQLSNLLPSAFMLSCVYIVLVSCLVDKFSLLASLASLLIHSPLPELLFWTQYVHVCKCTCKASCCMRSLSLKCVTEKLVRMSRLAPSALMIYLRHHSIVFAVVQHYVWLFLTSGQ